MGARGLSARSRAYACVIPCQAFQRYQSANYWVKIISVKRPWISCVIFCPAVLNTKLVKTLQDLMKNLDTKAAQVNSRCGCF